MNTIAGIQEDLHLLLDKVSIQRGGVIAFPPQALETYRDRAGQLTAEEQRSAARTLLAFGAKLWRLEPGRSDRAIAQLCTLAAPLLGGARPPRELAAVVKATDPRPKRETMTVAMRVARVPRRL